MMVLVFQIISAFSLSSNAKVQNWNECVAQAKSSNPPLQAAINSYEANEFDVNASYNGFLPQLEGDIKYGHGASDYGSRSSVTTSSYTTSLTVTQNLFSGLADQSKVDQAKATREASRQNLAIVSAQVNYELKTAFAGLLFSQNLIKLNADILRRREDNQKLVQLRFEGGRENKGSVLLSKAYYEQAKLDLLVAQNGLASARVLLNKLLGVDPSEEKESDLRVEGAVPISPAPASIELNKLALTTPAYLQSLAQENLADAKVSAMRSGFFPSLNLTGSLSNTGAVWYPPNKNWEVGATLTFPLFNGGRDFFSTKSANRNLTAAMFSKRSVFLQDISKLQQTFASYREAVQRLEVDYAFSEAANIREKISKQKYNNGLLSFEDWDIIENDLIIRQKNLLQSQRDRVVQEAAWDQAIGKGL